MIKILRYIFLISLSVICSCTEQTNNIFADKPFALITATDGMKTSISANVDNQNRIIRFVFNKEENINNIDLNFQLNPGYKMVSPNNTKVNMDLTSSQTVVVSSKDGERSYSIHATNEAPILSSSFEFRNENIVGKIDHESMSIIYPVNSIYVSEYPGILLSDIPLNLTFSDGYKQAGNKTTYNLLSDEVTVVKGQNSYTYKLIPDIKAKQVTNYLSDFKFKRGVNLAYWMVVGDSDRDWLGYITPAVFPLWKELGFDHFRVPVKEGIVFNEDGTLHKFAIDKLHELFTWCEENDMYAILDLHELEPRVKGENYREEELYDEQYPEFRQNFINKWDILSNEFKKYSKKHIAFELLNEHHDGKPDASEWCILQDMVMTAIRKNDPERVVLVPSMEWQSPEYIKYVKVAENDPNIVISFHYYLPMLLSHYKLLAWKDYQGDIQYPGLVIPTKADADKYPNFAHFHSTTYNATRILGEMAKAAGDGRNLGLPVHCGEFGCSKNVPETMRLQWFKDMVAAMESNNIPWTLWESLGGGFGFIDEDYKGANKINRDVLKILTGKELSEAQAKAILEKYGLKTY